jgi:DNA-binding transcriptional regulator of glucitol operon
VLTPRWILVHLGVLVLVVAFLLLGWWQVTRAADGNMLSYGYALEWPAFAVFAIWVWLKEVRRAMDSAAGDPASVVAAAPEPRVIRGRPRSEAAYDDSDDPELAAYNRYLAWRAANPHASAADYPG